MALLRRILCGFRAARMVFDPCLAVNQPLQTRQRRVIWLRVGLRRASLTRALGRMRDSYCTSLPTML